MTAEHSAGEGGEHAKQLDHESQRMALLKTIGEPIAVMRGDEVITVGISHGVKDDEVWVRNGAGELHTYGLDEFTFAGGDESDVVRYFDDIVPDNINREAI